MAAQHDAPAPPRRSGHRRMFREYPTYGDADPAERTPVLPARTDGGA